MAKDWIQGLRIMAREKGMCADNRARLNACENKEDAIKLYKKTIDWALENDYPDIDFLRSEFSNSQGQGIFVGEHFDGKILSEHDVYVFHNCTGTIRVGINLAKRIIPMCYFANNCDMTILGFDADRALPDRVPLYIFGENKIIAKNSPMAEFRIYRHETKKGGKK